MRAFTKDTIGVELSRIQRNLDVLEAVSNELKNRPDGVGSKLGAATAVLMDRLSNILDDMVDDIRTSIRELSVLTNRE